MISACCNPFMIDPPSTLCCRRRAARAGFDDSARYNRVAMGVFDGVTVLEFGQFVAIPYAGQMFADGGARVIKIEPSEGEPSRHLAPLAPHESRHFIMRNRGKHSLP